MPAECRGEAGADRQSAAEPLAESLSDRAGEEMRDVAAEAGDLALVEREGALQVVPSTDLAGTGSDVVGTVVWRFWPLDRLGPVSTLPAAS